MELREDIESLDEEELRALCMKLDPDRFDTSELNEIHDDRQTYLGDLMRYIRDVAQEVGDQELPIQSRKHPSGRTYDAWGATRWMVDDVHGLELEYASRVDSRISREAFVHVDGETQLHLYTRQRDPYEHSIEPEDIELKTYRGGDWTETLDVLLENPEQTIDGYAEM